MWKTEIILLLITLFSFREGIFFSLSGWGQKWFGWGQITLINLRLRWLESAFMWAGLFLVILSTWVVLQQSYLKAVDVFTIAPALWWALNLKFLFLNPISLKHCLTSQTVTGCLQISKCFEGKRRAKCHAYLFGLPFSEDLGSSCACFLDGSLVFSNRFFDSYFI